ncbi:MAG: hypothetical protein IJ060_10120 [Oscillospiraceae bacterium]|nr:hypothetical protein [Oscillospiraceae bacterium]
MMISEFKTLTGIHPSWLLWTVINRTYEESALDKHEWCKAYVENKNGMAGMIARLADTEYERAVRNHEIELKNARSEIAHLREQLEKTKAQLDRELEWHPATGIGTNMTEHDYQLLADDTAPMSELDAIRRIHQECRFDMAHIKIVTTVSTYEVNKHHECRVSKTFARQPVWASSDWNYIRFNVGALQWEIVNGELMPYCD